MFTLCGTLYSRKHSCYTWHDHHGVAGEGTLAKSEGQSRAGHTAVAQCSVIRNEGQPDQRVKVGGGGGGGLKDNGARTAS